MNTDNQVIQTQELIFLRLLEDFSQWVLLAPVIFAFVVVFLVIFYRQQETLTALLKTLFIPPVAITVLGIAWAVWLLVYAVAAIWLGMTVPDDTSAMALFRDQFVLYGLIPLVAYPALLGVLATVVICIKHPAAFIPLVFVALISSIYLMFAVLFQAQFGWWVVLAPVLFVALIYVALMYRQDSQSVHPLWASFLGLLRCCVYALLAFIFLMPGCQTYDTKITESKVLILVDISGSMHRIDALPRQGEDPDKLPNRLDNVINAVVNAKVLDDIQKLSPVSVYRFGARLDDYAVKQFHGGEKWTKEDWKEFLFPDLKNIEIPEQVNGKELDKEERDKLQFRLNNLYDGFTSGTNISGSALQALLRETGHDIQSIIIFSDGANNLSGSDALYELLTRANNPKKATHIITVCVGDYKEPKSIRVEDIQAPIQARPHDKFFVQVPVYGDRLEGREFEVELEIEQVVKKGDKWEPKSGGVKETLTEKGQFKVEGGKQAFDKVKFEIDVRKLKKITPAEKDTKDDQVMGYWQFTATGKVEPEQGEYIAKATAISKPAQTLVHKKKMRVLLFAGGPSREYQFLRTVLYREALENRLEMSVYLQTAKNQDNVDQDVPAERQLDAFPTSLAKDPLSDKEKFYDLTSYDVIIAIDPDWTELTNQQLDDINRWVGETWAGGFIFVAGPIFTYQLARDEKSVGKNLTPIKELLPVTLKDSRLVGLGVDLDPTRPYLLRFDQRASNIDFMKLSEEEKTPLEGWEEFFWEGEKATGNKPYNGFYSYYPVEKIREGGLVLATFDRPTGNPLVPDLALKEPPFIAAQSIGKGQSLYLGSGEFWRLRQIDEEFHKRFWLQAIQYAGIGTQSQIHEHGVVLMAQKAPVGLVSLEAQLMKASKAPVSEDAEPVVKVTVLEAPEKDTKKTDLEPFKLKPRSDGIWTGWFQGEFKVQTPGRYRLSIDIPGTNQEIDHVITVYRPDPELDNPRPNHDHLYELATSAIPIFKQVDKKYLPALQSALQGNEQISKEKKDQFLTEGKDELRLCFKLDNSELIAACLTKVPPTEESLKGGLTFLMDQGVDSDLALRGDEMIMAVGGGVGLLIGAILLLTRRWLFAAVVLALTGLVVGSVLLMNAAFEPNWDTFPINFSFVLFTIVGLLCLEWLTRKLLRLA